MMKYFGAFLVFCAGFAIIDANREGLLKHNELAGFIGYLLELFAVAIIFL